MLKRLILAWVALCGVAVAARAADSIAPTPTPTAPTLPSLALDPQGGPLANTSSTGQQPSLWNGLYVGTDVFGVAGKGVQGGFGGSGYVGYDHEFANNVVVGIQAGAGYAPGLSKFGPKGYDFASTNVMVGYDLGRFEPYVTMGVDLAKPTGIGNRGFTSASDSVNGLFDSSGNLQSLTTVGAGFNYAITNNLSMGMEVSVTNGRGALAPW
jgi:outer membrane immunogenic protein